MCIRDRNKPWKYGQLIATVDFPIYKDDALVNREQDSLLASFQPYYLLDKQVEKDAIAKLKENYHTHLKGILPVSYTHLDVYKRQLHIQTTPFQASKTSILQFRKEHHQVCAYH